MISRRSLIFGAPAIVLSANIMPVRAFAPLWVRYAFTCPGEMFPAPYFYKDQYSEFIDVVGYGKYERFLYHVRKPGVCEVEYQFVPSPEIKVADNFVLVNHEADLVESDGRLFDARVLSH